MQTEELKDITACGENCTKCQKKLNGECPGCIEADGYVPGWAESGRCKVHACAKEHNAQFCALCSEFPCDKMEKLIHWNSNIMERMIELREKFGGNRNERK